MESSGVILLSLTLLLAVYAYRVCAKNHNYFKKRGIAFSKPTLFFGNMLDAIKEQEDYEVTLGEFYKKFRTEKWGNKI